MENWSTGKKHHLFNLFILLKTKIKKKMLTKNDKTDLNSKKSKIELQRKLKPRPSLLNNPKAWSNPKTLWKNRVIF